jgi:hypothetical protein
MKPELSIVIVTYNAQDVILDCLASLESTCSSLGDDHVDAEVIVVDNASTDRTIALLRERPANVQLIETGYNAGYSGGNNAGIRASTAPLILLLNPDTVVHPGALRALVDFARDRPEAGLIGCRLLYPDGKLQHSCFHFPGLRTAFFGFFPLVPLDSTCNGRYPTSSYEQSHPVERLLGAALLVRRQMIEGIGLLDERTFPMYFEETDWCYRAQQAGWQVYYTPEATVTHHEAFSTSRYPERMSAAFYRSQARFFRRHYGLWAYAALKAIVVPGLLFWWLRSTRSWLFRRVTGQTWKRRARSYWEILWA